MTAAPGHLTPATLVEWALRDDDPGEDGDTAAHLADCPGCREQLSRLRRVVSLARAIEAPDLPEPPSRQVWERIARDLRGTGEPDAD